MSDTSGPAFPVITPDMFSSDSTFKAFSGLSKRELFAAMAPAKEIRDMTPDTIGTCAVFIGIDPEDYDGEMHYPLVLAKVRCAWADALLAELAKELPR